MPKREYSHSKLSTFENCPRKFDYRYVQRITRDTESIEAFLGKRVHEILERLHHHMARHGRPPSLRQVQDRYRQDWELHHHDKVEIVRDDRDLEFYRLQGDRCLENYYRKFYPFDEGEKVGIEQRVSIQLDDGGEYRARGIIDLVVRAGNQSWLDDPARWSGRGRRALQRVERRSEGSTDPDHRVRRPGALRR